MIILTLSFRINFCSYPSLLLENSQAVRIRPVNEINHYVMQTVKPTTRELNKNKLKGL